MTPYVFALGVGLCDLAMVIYPRLFGRLLSAVSKIDSTTSGINPKEREIRDGFGRAAGAVLIFVALVTVEFP